MANRTRRRLPWSGLRALDAFARRGRMTLAAEELGLTHGAVSRAIKTLEGEAGFPLVTGTTSRVELTSEGQKLAGVVALAFDQITQALEEGRGQPERLNISCLGTFAAKWLIPRLPRFASIHPRIEVHVHEAAGLARLPERGFDAAIRMVDDDRFDTQTVIRFLQNHHGPVFAARLAARHPALTTRLHTRTYRPAWDDWQRDAGVKLPGPVSHREFDHIFYTLEAAAAGLGVAIAPWPYVYEDLANGRLAAPHGFVRSKADYALIASPGEMRAALSAFADWLVNEGGAVPVPAR